MGRIEWLLLDYGEVVSSAQPESDRERLVAHSGLAAAPFWERYWAQRPGFDSGELTARAYWSSVLERAVTAAELDALEQSDIASWTHLNEATLALLRRAHAAGLQLALLSNVPHGLAQVLRERPEMGIFGDNLYFSCELGVAKPRAEAFLAVLRKLGVPPAAVLFVDDRPENVEAAQRLGITASVFRGANHLREEIVRLRGSP